jgi:hypothetical protein
MHGLISGIPFCRYFFHRRRHLSEQTNDFTPLMAAVVNGDTDSIQSILSTAAAAGQLKLDVKDKQGCTVFHHVAKASNERIALVSSYVSRHNSWCYFATGNTAASVR